MKGWEENKLESEARKKPDEMDLAISLVGWMVPRLCHILKDFRATCASHSWLIKSDFISSFVLLPRNPFCRLH